MLQPWWVHNVDDITAMLLCWSSAVIGRNNQREDNSPAQCPRSDTTYSSETEGTGALAQPCPSKPRARHRGITPSENNAPLLGGIIDRAPEDAGKLHGGCIIFAWAEENTAQRAPSREQKARMSSDLAMTAAESERLIGSSGLEHELGRLADDDDGDDNRRTEPPPGLRENPSKFQRRRLGLSARGGSLHMMTNSRENT